MPDQDIGYYTAWLLVEDKAFQETNLNADARVFPKGPLRYLVSAALKRQTVLGPDTLRVMLDADKTSLRRAGAEASLVSKVFEDLENGFTVKLEDLPAMREMASAWLRRRSMILSLDTAREALDKGEVEEAEKALSKSSYNPETRPTPLLLTETADSILAGTRKLTPAVPTGLYALDRAWRGGIRRSELGIILGATNTGKSMVVCHLAAEAFWANRYVLYYTSELTDQQVLERIACGILRMGKADIPEGVSFAALVSARADRERLPYPEKAQVEVRPGDLTMDGLNRDLEELKSLHGRYPGLVILDSADDIIPPIKTDKTYEGLRAIYSVLRSQVCQAKRIPVWTTSQTNREAVDKARVSLKHIGDAFAKAQRAHYVLGLAQSQAEREHPDGPLMNVYVLKDTLHGTRGAWFQCHVDFGFGDNGFAGIEVLEHYGLTVSARD